MIMTDDDKRFFLREAVGLANFHHSGHKDLAGRPYIEHVFGVCALVSGIDEKIVALLHDILEDTKMTEVELRRMMPTWVADAVVAMTHVKGETYSAYIKRLSENRLARRVKIADLKNNLSPDRSMNKTPGSVARVQKYTEALSQLVNVETFGNFIGKEYGYDYRKES